MGIPGLWKGMPTVKGRVEEFAGGKSVAVDASGWLHKAGYACPPEKLVESNGLDTGCIKIYCRYVEQRCLELLSFGKVKHVYMVFDNGKNRCPLKSHTNQAREERRKINLQMARNSTSPGDKDKYYRLCVKGNTIMAQKVIQSLRYHRRITCVTAPYEADAQLAKLAKDGCVQAIITEDSDVLLYSATCRAPVNILMKLDLSSGTCLCTNMQWILTPNNPKDHSFTNNKNKTKLERILQAFAQEEALCQGVGVRLLVQASVLTGCDYVSNTIAGVGLVQSFNLINQHKHVIPEKRFKIILKSKGVSSLQQYELRLAQSEVVFYHHMVLGEPNQTSMVPLVMPSSITPNLTRFMSTDLEFVGQNNILSTYIPPPPDKTGSNDRRQIITNSLDKDNPLACFAYSDNLKQSSCKTKTVTKSNNPMNEYNISEDNKIDSINNNSPKLSSKTSARQITLSDDDSSFDEDILETSIFSSSTKPKAIVTPSEDRPKRSESITVSSSDRKVLFSPSFQRTKGPQQSHYTLDLTGDQRPTFGQTLSTSDHNNTLQQTRSSSSVSKPIIRSPFFSSFANKKHSQDTSPIKPINAHNNNRQYISAFQSGQNMNRLVHCNNTSNNSNSNKRLKSSPNSIMAGFRKQQEMWQNFSGRSEQIHKQKQKYRAAKNSTITSFFQPIMKK